MSSNYEIIIYWSEDDVAFVAGVPELPGCMAEGRTYQEAVAHVEVIIKEWIRTAKELGRLIPQPRGRLMLPDRVYDRFGLNCIFSRLITPPA